jgi:hypothetical protein
MMLPLAPPGLPPLGLGWTVDVGRKGAFKYFGEFLLMPLQ